MAVTVREATNRALLLCGHIAPDATYTTTAKQAADIAVTKLAHVNAAGAVDEARAARYYGMAVPLLAELQAQLCRDENPFEAVTAPVSIDSVLSLSDGNAQRVLPAALAMGFALADRDILAYNALAQEYYEVKLPELEAVATGDAHKYAKAAPEYCNMLQAELLHLEGNHNGADPLQTLDDYLSVTDDTGIRVLPAGLAKLFALLDGDTERFPVFAAEYEAAKQSVSAGTSPVNDHYNCLLDGNLAR